jgi:TolA-binding protein
MSIRVVRVLVVPAAMLACLGGCSSSAKLSDLWTPKTNDASASADASGAAPPEGGFKFNDLWTPRSADGSNWITGKPGDTTGSVKPGDTTGSVNVPTAETPPGAPHAPPPPPGILGDNAKDDLQLGKKYFRNNNYALAEKSFRSAVEKHPRDAEAWVGLAAAYDRLHRFDLADRAYEEAIRLVGPAVEILNNQGFSYMLRGDYARAHKKLEEAAAKDPGNPYVAANLRLLQESYREGKAVQ